LRHQPADALVTMKPKTPPAVVGILALCVTITTAGCAGAGATPAATGDGHHVTLTGLSRGVDALAEHTASTARAIDASVNAKAHRRARGLQADARRLQMQLDLLALRIRANAAARQQLFADLEGRLAAVRHRRHYHGRANKSAGHNDQTLPTFDQRRAYVPAFMLLRRGKLTPARLALARYLKQFPASYYSADALYWLAEIDYVQGRMDLAHADFNKLVREHPKDDKAPAALLRLGQIAEQQGQSAQARALFRQVAKRYPHSAEAGLARRWVKQVTVSAGPDARNS